MVVHAVTHQPAPIQQLLLSFRSCAFSGLDWCYNSAIGLRPRRYSNQKNRLLSRHPGNVVSTDRLNEIQVRAHRQRT